MRARERWRDPRIAIGLILIVLSVVVATSVMRAMDHRVEVWAARTTLTPGTDLAGNVTTAKVHADLAALYLPAASDSSGSVTRTVGAGELISRSAVTRDSAEHATRSIVLPLGTALPEHAERGTVVDVWFLPQAIPGKDAPEPRIVAPGALIEHRHEPEGIGVRAFGTVEVSVPEGEVPAVLAALAAKGLIAVVPAGAGP
ncbi:MAG: hypothetical protein Q4P36_04510 [Bowdeniella nasicola]|nr:hypothetical protein [Bowdeniella nasicola]